MFDIIFSVSWVVVIALALFWAGFKIGNGGKALEVIMFMCCCFSGDLTRKFMTPLRLLATGASVWAINHYLHTPVYAVLVVITYGLAILAAYKLHRNCDIEFVDTSSLALIIKELADTFK